MKRFIKKTLISAFLFCFIGINTIAAASYDVEIRAVSGPDEGTGNYKDTKQEYQTSEIRHESTPIYRTAKEARKACKFKYKFMKNIWCSDKEVVQNCEDGVRNCQYGYVYIETVINNDVINNSVVTQPYTTYEYAVYNPDGTTDSAYCLQPGKPGPSREAGNYRNLYVENAGSYDLSTCDDDLKNHYYCGVAQILYQSIEPKVDASGKKIYVKRADAPSYMATLAAVRMWSAYYEKHVAVGIGGLTGTAHQGQDGYEYTSNTPLYLNTALAAEANNYTGAPCTSVANGVFCDEGEYKESIRLFNDALEMLQGKDDDKKFLDGEITKAEDKELKITKKQTDTNVTATIDVPEGLKEEFAKCAMGDFKNENSNCGVYFELRDENGTKITNYTVSREGDKYKVSFDIGNKCNQITKKTFKYKFSVKLKNYSTEGYIKQYLHYAEPNAKQVMMVLAINQTNGSNNNGKTITVELAANCNCDPDEKCTEFDPVTKLPENCSGKGVLNAGKYDDAETGSIEEPYMNCILNACDDSQKEPFDYSQEFGVNTDVCRVYCREDVIFYLASKVKVYSGMQFRYDIGAAPAAQADTLPVAADKKLSSIVLQKRQCATEIYYDKENKSGDTWIDLYNEAIDELETAYNAWKEYEALYDWESKNGGPNEVTAMAKDSQKGSYSCKNNTCRTAAGECPSYTVRSWPTITHKDVKTSSGSWTGSQDIDYKEWNGMGTCKIDKATQKVTCNKGSAGQEDTYRTDGSFNTGTSPGSCGSSSCNWDNCCSKPCCSWDKDGNCTGNCCRGCYRDSYSTNNNCSKGEASTNATMRDEENREYKSYEAALNKIEQLVYDLQNCNLYESSEIKKMYSSSLPYEYHTLTSKYSHAIQGGTTKDYILKQANCTGNSCLDMAVEYDDYYGEKTKQAKQSAIINSNENGTKYCVETDTKKCFEYIRKKDVKITGSNKKTSHDYYVCSGVRQSAKCEIKTVNLPINDYATFTTVTEIDFYQPKTYQTEAFTGVVTEGTGDSTDKNQSPLGLYTYPVEKAKKTGSYDVNFYYTNMGSRKGALIRTQYENFTYQCSVDVLNTTNQYDCDLSVSQGSVNLDYCKNPGYIIEDGVPNIKNDRWQESTETKYGFVFRNVELSDIFPAGEKTSKDPYKRVGRETGNNWTSSLSVYEGMLDKMENAAEEIITNEADTNQYLEYRYILTPESMNDIKEYNRRYKSEGYLNNTLEKCILIDEGTTTKSFYRCESSFLSDELPFYTGVEVLRREKDR